MSTLRHMPTPADTGARAPSHNFASPPAEAWLNRFAQLSQDTQARLGVPLGTALLGESLPTPRWVAASEGLARELGWPADWALCRFVWNAPASFR